MEIDIKKLAWTVHLFLVELRTQTSETTNEVFRRVFLKEGYPESLVSLLSLTNHWTNDLAWWVEDVFGIETYTSSSTGWRINNEKFDACSDEFFDRLHELIKEKYEESRK